jgi:hypothetical protein
MPLGASELLPAITHFDFQFAVFRTCFPNAFHILSRPSFSACSIVQRTDKLTKWIDPSSEEKSSSFRQEILTQNYWVFGIFPSSGILGTRKHDVSKTGSVSVLRYGGENTRGRKQIQFPKRRVF